MTDVIQRLREFRQSSRSSVVTGIEQSSDPDRPTVQHTIEPWLVDLILEQLTNPTGPALSLVVLAGNAGDGKSYLLRAVRDRLRAEQDLDPSMVTWLLDATESDHQQQLAVDRLKSYFSVFADDQVWGQATLHVAAMNTGTMVRFMASDQDERRFSCLCDVLSLQLAVRMTPELRAPSSDFWERFDRILVIDLDRRMLCSLDEGEETFSDQLFSTLDRTAKSGFLAATGDGCTQCEFAGTCPVNANLTALASPRVRRRLNTLLRDVTLEDRIHLGPRSMWHLVYQMTVGALDAYALRSHRPLRTCADMGTLDEDERSRALFFASLFDAPQEGADAGGAAVSIELARVDPARRFTIEAYEVSLAAALSSVEDARLCESLAQDLDVTPEVLSGPPEDAITRAANAVRRAFFLAPDEPNDDRDQWLKDWAMALKGHREEVLSGSHIRHVSVSLLINVLTDLYQSADNDRLWELSLPWRSLANLYAQLILKPGPQQRAEDPRVLGPDAYREGGLRAVARELADALSAYPLSITVPLRNGPEVRVNWPLYRLLRRVQEQAYVAGSLDPERVQNLERIGASLGAKAAIDQGVAVLVDGRGLVCEDDGAGGYDVIDL